MRRLISTFVLCPQPLLSLPPLSLPKIYQRFWWSFDGRRVREFHGPRVFRFGHNRSEIGRSVSNHARSLSPIVSRVYRLMDLSSTYTPTTLMLTAPARPSSPILSRHLQFSRLVFPPDADPAAHSKTVLFSTLLYDKWTESFYQYRIELSCTHDCNKLLPFQRRVSHPKCPGACRSSK